MFTEIGSVPADWTWRSPLNVDICNPVYQAMNLSEAYNNIMNFIKNQAVYFTDNLALSLGLRLLALHEAWHSRLQSTKLAGFGLL